jgi:hypothetical protein
MSNTYVWHLGFDINAAQSSDGTSYLQNGFVQHTLGGSIFAAPVDLQVNDTIDFSLFNLTSLSSSNEMNDFSIVGGTITFSAAQTNQVAASPFSVTQIPIEPRAATSITGPSLVFDGEFQKWPLVDSRTIANNGRFLMTVALIVQGPDGPQRTFVVDPEMIVGGAT